MKTTNWTVTNCNHPDYLDIDGETRICSIPISKEILEEQELTRAEVEANARLIAAAPELLQALQTILEFDEITNAITMGGGTPHLEKAFAAIKKATE